MSANSMYDEDGIDGPFNRAMGFIPSPNAKVIHLSAAREDGGFKAEARETIHRLRAQAKYRREEAAKLSEQADKFDHDANELEAKLKAAEYVAENDTPTNPFDEHTRMWADSFGKVDHTGQRIESPCAVSNIGALSDATAAGTLPASPTNTESATPLVAVPPVTPRSLGVESSSMTAESLCEMPVHGSTTYLGRGLVAPCPECDGFGMPVASCSTCGKLLSPDGSGSLSLSSIPPLPEPSALASSSDATNSDGGASASKYGACRRCETTIEFREEQLNGICSHCVGYGLPCGHYLPGAPRATDDIPDTHLVSEPCSEARIGWTSLLVIDPRNIYTNSHLRSGRRCARERHLAYDLGYRSLYESDAATFGTMGHKALEAWFKAASDSDRLPAALFAIETHDTSDPYDQAKLRALIKGYDARWIDEQYEVLEVEVELPHVPILHPDTGVPHPRAVQGGKIDVLVRSLTDGLVYVLDHKFTSDDTSPGSRYWRQRRMDTQVSFYLDGAPTLGHGDASGWIHDVISKPALRPRGATPEDKRRFTKKGTLDKRQREADESPEEYEQRIIVAITEDPTKFYQRELVVRLDSELEAHRRDVWDHVEIVEEAREANRFPRNPDACERFGSVCPFFAVCSGQASIDDPLQFRRVEWPHVELTPNTETEKESTHGN